MEHLHEGGDGGAVPVAVPRLEVEVGGGAAGALAGLLGGEELGAARALRVEEPLPDHAGLLRAVGLGPGDDAAEVGVRAGEPRGAVGHVGGAAEEGGGGLGLGRRGRIEQCSMQKRALARCSSRDEAGVRCS